MKLKETLNKIWIFLDGKKTYIGLTGHALWLIANMVFKDLTTPEQAAYGHLVIGGFTGVGLGSKAQKFYDGKK